MTICSTSILFQCYCSMGKSPSKENIVHFIVTFVWAIPLKGNSLLYQNYSSMGQTPSKKTFVITAAYRPDGLPVDHIKAFVRSFFAGRGPAYSGPQC